MPKKPVGVPAVMGCDKTSALNRGAANCKKRDEWLAGWRKKEAQR